MSIGSKVAAITGASSGLGAEMARQLARSGYKVGLTARRVDELERLAASIRDEGHIACVAPGDAADPSSTREALARIARELGPIDLLIANAGVALGTDAANFSADVFDQMVRVNLSGVAYAIEAVLPSMLERGRGQIVGISSLAGVSRRPRVGGLFRHQGRSDRVAGRASPGTSTPRSPRHRRPSRLHPHSDDGR